MVPQNALSSAGDPACCHAWPDLISIRAAGLAADSGSSSAHAGRPSNPNSRQRSDHGCLQFEGGVICISHNTQLLSRVCDDAERAEVWLVEDGKVMEYDGMFEDYKDDLLAEITADLEED